MKIENEHYNKKINAGIPANPANYANLHERLFGFGRHGVMVAMIVLQFFFTLSIVYSSLFVVYTGLYSYDNYVKGSQPDYLTILTGMFVCPFVLIATSYLFLPGILSCYAINTNIEMMKDRTLVE